ncbi:anti-sigma factor family protein [Bythopirellula goksoeyrii]|uniref:Zinc-finger domain-containing protein n=1 Tax=Bythopirellula goksoeyrii TaxID=1400387 RepID=A0A5B9QFM4_9BACT|nr:hypothetical protein Pr1d_03920 [Bythopirellula goksoeyrii]
MIEKIKQTFAVANMNCREASVLLANVDELELSRWHRFGLWAHLLVCGTCRQFRDQMRFLKQLVASAPTELLDLGFSRSTRLSTQCASRIKALLREEASKQ